MGEVLDIVTKAIVLIFVVTCMVAAGLGLTLRDVASSFHPPRRVVAAILANFVIAPAVAYGLTRAFALKATYETGLLLLGGAAGAPFLTKLAEGARGDLAYSVGLMLLLMVGSVVFMPLALPIMIPGLNADAWTILQPLLTTMLLPLLAAMVVRRGWPASASRWRPAFVAVSNLSGVITLVLLLGRNLPAILGTFGSGAALIGGLFVTLTFAAGYFLGGSSPESRIVLGLGTGQRNIAAALLIATQNFPDPDVVVMLLVTTIVGLVILLTASSMSVRRRPPSPLGVSSHVET